MFFLLPRMVRVLYRNFNDCYKACTLSIDPSAVSKTLDFRNATIKNISIDQQLKVSFLPDQQSLVLPSSSPSKRISKNLEFCNIEGIKDYDLSNIQCVFDSEKCKSFVNKEVELCTVDKTVDGYLKKLDNEGVCDLGLEDVSYGVKSSPVKYLPLSEATGIKVSYFYTSTQTESVIGIPKANPSNITRDLLTIKIKETLNKSQTGKQKVKVLVLTPRNDASWLQRKLSTVIFPDKSGYDYIIVRVRKSFTKNLKACIGNLF